MKYEIENFQRKYIIHELNPAFKFGLYVSGVKRNGDYIFTTDYTYAKTMTLKTAEKHKSILEAKEDPTT